MKAENALQVSKIVSPTENKNLNFSKTNLLPRRLTASRLMPSWLMRRIHFGTSIKSPRKCKKSCGMQKRKPNEAQLRVAHAPATRLNRR